MSDNPGGFALGESLTKRASKTPSSLQSPVSSGATHECCMCYAPGEERDGYIGALCDGCYARAWHADNKEGL